MQRFRIQWLLLLIILSVAPAAQPQSSSIPSAEVQNAGTIRVQVDQVPIEIVVRDKQGKAVGNLTRDDFEVYDNSVLQTIKSFRLERSEARAKNEMAPPNGTMAVPSAQAPTLPYPRSFIVYLIDDLHLQMPEMIDTKKAIEKSWSSMRDADRAALFTTSGRVMVDFTSDRAELLKSLAKVKPGTALRQNQRCPWMNYYLADLVEDKSDRWALGKAIADTIQCVPLDGVPRSREIAEGMVHAAAQAELATGGYQTRLALEVVRTSIARLANAPGRRLLVLASPGFLALMEQSSTASEVMDFAVRSEVVINSIDLKRLSPDPSFDSSHEFRPAMALFVSDSARMSGDVLGQLAYATGGTFFHNSNDLNEGFQGAAGFPEYSYLLTYAPSRLKHDGEFHSIKVKLRKSEDRKGYSVHARNGYYDQKPGAEPKKRAKAEIEAAMFSRNDIRELPIALRTEITKNSAGNPGLLVVTRVPLSAISFERADGRNSDSVTFISGVFDESGQLVQGSRRDAELHLKDESLKDSNRGIFDRVEFLLKPGKYVVRAVVRDAHGSKLGATSESVEVQ